MDMARVWPIVCQYSVGGILLALGIWSGISSGYLDLNQGRDRRLLYILAGGFLFLLVLVSIFTFWLPYVSAEGGA
jgi:ACR3 family arsenite efflux pump ArsB